MTAQLKDHQIAQLVNRLRDIAVEHHGHQCLRELISREVTQALVTTERKGEPAKSLVIQCPMCSDFDPDAACHFCSLLSVHDVEEWRNAVVIAKPVPNTGMVPVKARTILAVDRLIANAVAAQAQPTNTSPQVPEGHPLMVFAIECEMGALQEHEVPLKARQAINAARKGE